MRAGDPTTRNCAEYAPHTTPVQLNVNRDNFGCVGVRDHAIVLPSWVIGVIVSIVITAGGAALGMMRDMYIKLDKHEELPGHTTMVERVKNLEAATNRMERKLDRVLRKRE